MLPHDRTNILYMDARKYGRTLHYPFSPGTTSDDRIRYDYWEQVQKMPAIIHTEKLDGENNCLSRYGVFARSHAAPSVAPWTAMLRAFWNTVKNDLSDLEIFGENLYAIHSIAYQKIEHHYYVFAVRCRDKWLGWEEVCFYAAMFDLPTVPVLQIITGANNESLFRENVIDLANESSVFDAVDAGDRQRCTREGIVSRNVMEFAVDGLADHVFKYVRKGHVKTDEHWTRNWKRAPLLHEQKDNDHGKDME